MKEFHVKQNLTIFAIPVAIDVLIFILGAISSGIFRFILLGIAAAFLGVIIYQSKPILKSFALKLTPKEVRVLDFTGKTVRRVDWRRVEGAAAGRRKILFINMYSFYFRVKGDEDINFILNSRESDLSQKFRNFIRVFVRRNVPVQIVKS